MITVTSLEIQNIGLIEAETITFDKPLLLFYGAVREGKTTILNCVRWVLGAPWPEDIIRHGAEEGGIRFNFVGGRISRSWYRGKDGKTKARDITMVRDNGVVRKPMAEISKFLNPFLLDQDYLRKMSEPERKAFFAELLAVDTQDLDMEAAALASQAKELRAGLKAYGDLGDFNPIPVEPVDVQMLWEQRAEIIEHNNRRVAEARAEMKRLADMYRTHLNAATERNREIDNHNHRRGLLVDRMEEIDRQIAELTEARNKLAADVQDFQLRQPELLPAEPDTTDLLMIADTPADTKPIDQMIADAAAHNVLAAQWLKDKERVDAKNRDEAELKRAEERLRIIKAEKAGKLAAVSDTCGVPGLAFDDEGNVIYEGTTAGMLSTSQIMRLSAAISALYPPGFGIDLIDRAESLGEDVMLYVDLAKREEKTILATIVGNAPAKSPPEVGVFIVKGGKIHQQEML